MSVFEQVAALGRDRHGCVLLGELRDAGLSEGRIRTLVRTGFLLRRRAGVFVLVGSASTWEQDLAVAVFAAGPQALASHRSAAGLWRLGGFRPGHVELVSPRWLWRTRGDARQHETLDLPGRDRGIVSGIPVTSPTRTLVDMGRFVGEARLGSMVDDAVRRRLTTYEALHERFRELARRGRNGIATVRGVLAERPGGAPVPGSDFEGMVRRLLTSAGLPAPMLQCRVDCGELAFLLDLAWPDARLAVECEGFAYHSTPDQLAWDERRRNLLQMAGWLVLAYSWRRAHDDGPGVVDEVRRALRLRLAA